MTAPALASSTRAVGGRALVLNATYEPICVVSVRRAIVLVMAGKADVLHASAERLVRSERLAVEAPTVIRLRYFVKVPYRRRASLSRRAVLARDGHSCQYCGRRADTVDHVVPRSRGGQHRWENLVAACRPCNAHKRDRLLPETSMRLQRRPRAPRELSWIVFAVGRVPDDWEPYLQTHASSA